LDKAKGNLKFRVLENQIVNLSVSISAKRLNMQKCLRNREGIMRRRRE
jgi:hypothetical protein